MKHRIRVLIADDSAPVREILSRYLGEQSFIEVVGLAEDGDDAVGKTKHLHPDLVLMDINMPKLNGLKATRIIKAAPHAPKLIVLSLDDDVAFGVAASTAGADGFCSKLDTTRALLPMIRSLFPDVTPEEA